MADKTREQFANILPPPKSAESFQMDQGVFGRFIRLTLVDSDQEFFLHSLSIQEVWMPLKEKSGAIIRVVPMSDTDDGVRSVKEGVAQVLHMALLAGG